MDEMKTKDASPERERKGIPLKKLSISIAVITAVISAFLLLGIFFTYRNYRQMIDVSQEFVSWNRNAENMLVASDLLTEDARMFAETGDTSYMNDYFYESDVTKTREKSLAYITDLFGESVMVDSLRNAMNKSVELMNLEYYAMRLKCESLGLDLSSVHQKVREAELSVEDRTLSADEQDRKARELLHGPYYSQMKTRISNSTHECLDNLVSELSRRQQVAESRLKFALIFELAMILLFISLSILIVVLTSSQVFDPIIHSIPYIKNDSPLPVQGAYELRVLAHTYNTMYEAHRRSRNVLKYKADHDALTGVLNRRAFDQFKKASNDGKVAFLLLDLDDFKQVNDTYGHYVGDRVLVKVVSLLRSYFPEKSDIFRIGGDEFAIVLLGADRSAKNEIEKKIDTLNSVLAQNETEDIPVISVSVGVSFGSVIDKNLIDTADRMLYERKRSGKIGCSFAE